jgi:hypothetical protein
VYVEYRTTHGDKSCEQSDDHLYYIALIHLIGLNTRKAFFLSSNIYEFVRSMQHFDMPYLQKEKLEVQSLNLLRR